MKSQVLERILQENYLPATSITSLVHGYLLNCRCWLTKEGFIPDNPVDYIKTPKTDHKVVQPLTPDGVRGLLDACSSKSMLDVRNKAILSVLLDTGLRVSELASLKLEDMDLNTGAILAREERGHVKNRGNWVKGTEGSMALRYYLPPGG